MRLLLLSVGIALAGMLQGCKATTAPSSMEASLLNQAKHRLFIGNRNAQDPLAATPKNVADGKEAFGHYCIVCHGLDGQNTGVPFADHMKPRIPSLASQQVQSYTDGQLKWIIDNGIAPTGMPAAQGILSDDEQWAIVVFLRHLPPAGSLGEPAFYGN
jgi:mono/diheme cytochrome c family protein